MTRHYNIPVFVPHIGCPHDCVFCNQRVITGAKTDPDQILKDAKNSIEMHLSTIPKAQAAVQIAFFGGSFTGIDSDLQRALLCLSDEYIQSGRASSVRISTRPDYIDENILNTLKDHHVTDIELGVQSSDDGVLRANRRGHTFARVTLACKLIRSQNINLGLQMMTGMYTSTPALDKQTAADIAMLAPDYVRIYPTVVLNGTYLASLYQNYNYIPPTLEDSVALCSEIYRMFHAANIPIIRMGLQATDTICEQGDLIAGSYHSAFGELVLSRIYRNKLESAAQNATEDRFAYYVPARELSRAIGNKRCNVTYIAEKYHKTVQIKPL